MKKRERCVPDSAAWAVRQSGLFEGFSKDRFVLAAQCLMLVNIVAITRAFALVSLIEFLLWCLFLFYQPLRSGFLNSFKDIRIKLLFVFWGWVAVATIWADVSIGLRFEEVWSWRKVLLFPMAWVLFKEERTKKFAIFVVIGIASVFMVFSWLGHLGLVQLDRAPSQLLENHSTQGVFFASASFVLLMSLKDDLIPTPLKLLIICLIAGMMSNIMFVLTGRTGYVSLLVMAPFAVWILSTRYKWSAAVATVLLISFGLSHSPTAQETITRGFQEINQTIDNTLDHGSSMGFRWLYWENSLRMVGERPFLGTGSGAFSLGYSEIVKNAEGWRATVTDDPHQQYLLIAGEQGLIGLSLFLATILLLLASRGDDSYRLGAVGILVATSANGFFNGHFNSFVEGRLVWIMCGVLLSCTIPITNWTDAKTSIQKFTINLWGLISLKQSR